MRLNSKLRLSSLWLVGLRALQAAVCLLIAALCCRLLPVSELGLGDPNNTSIWACATTAALSLVVLKRSQ